MARSSLVSLVLLAACAGKDDADGVDTDDTDVVDSDPPLEPGFFSIADGLPVDVTPDGRTAALMNLASAEGEVWFVDTRTEDVTSPTTVGDPTKAVATGIASDRSLSALHGNPVQAGLWTEDGDWNDLASPFATGCDPDFGGAFDLSDDGSVVVGLMWEGCSPAAFRWTEADGVDILDRVGEAPEGSLSPPINRATVVSGDGEVVAGFAAYGVLDRSPAVWTADGRGELLDPDETELPGEVLAIDGDGSTMAGIRGLDAWVWTKSGFTAIPRVDTALPSDPVFPNVLTEDGRAVFGAVGSDFFGVPVAFVWTEADGTRALQPLVEEAGVTLPEGWTLTGVLAASSTGDVLVGLAFDEAFTRHAFVLRLDPAAYGL